MTTKTIAEIDRTSIKIIDKEVIAAMNEIAKKFGLAYEGRGGSFNPSVGTFRIAGEFSLPDAPRKEFEKYVFFIRDREGKPMFTKDDFGRSFPTQGRLFTITGINARASKNPIEATRDDGAKFKFPADVARAMLDLVDKK